MKTMSDEIMTLDGAIKHAEEVADVCEFEASKYDMTDAYESHVAYQEGKCAEEHRQLAGWLKELKQLREQTRRNSAMVGKNEFKDIFTLAAKSMGSTCVDFVKEDSAERAHVWMNGSVAFDVDLDACYGEYADKQRSAEPEPDEHEM